jgi:glucose/arabinose dehydrogenase
MRLLVERVLQVDLDRRESGDTHVEISARRLLEGEGWRIRDVAVGPEDGYIHVIADHESAPLLRLVPDENDDV